MPNPIYALPSDNVTAAASLSLGTGTANALYPLTNLVNKDPMSIFLTSSTIGLDILLDSAAAQRVDVISIHGHNFPAGTAIHFQRNATNSWGAPTQDGVVIVAAYPNDGLPLPIYIDMTAVSGYSTGGLRWTRIHVAALGQIAGIGELALWARKRTDIKNVRYPAKTIESQPGRVFPTAYGRKRRYGLGVRLRSHPALFRLAGPDEAAMVALFRSAKGQLNPFLWVRDTTISDCFLATLATDVLDEEYWAPDPSSGWCADLAVTIEELGSGVAIPTA